MAPLDPCAHHIGVARIEPLLYIYSCSGRRGALDREDTAFIVSKCGEARVMSGSPEVVQAIPVSASVSTVETAAPRPEPGDAERRPVSGISKIAWVPPADLEQAEWLSTGRRLGAIGRCSQWWIGDWIRFGTARWGERYTEAARVTGYDVASLRNMAWVAAQFDLSLRSDKLSWSHHVLLAPLPEDEQRHWIAKAVEQRLSVADLRLELRARRHADRELAQGSAGDGRSQEGVGVCPHCGHALNGSGG